MADDQVDLSPDEVGDAQPDDDVTLLVGVVQPGDDDETIRLYLRGTDDYLTIPSADVVARERIGDGASGSLLSVKLSEAPSFTQSEESRERTGLLVGQLTEAVAHGEVSGYQLSEGDEVEGFTAHACAAAFGAGVAFGVGVGIYNFDSIYAAAEVVVDTAADYIKGEPAPAKGSTKKAK